MDHSELFQSYASIGCTLTPSEFVVFGDRGSGQYPAPPLMENLHGKNAMSFVCIVVIVTRLELL